jgi:GAF domain-containing protein/HAMP domain-containing protein
MNRLFRLLRQRSWRDLTIRAKLGLIFGLQMALIVGMGTTSVVALRNVQRQRDALREAQRLASLSAELQFQFVEAREVQNAFLLGWNDVGYEDAVELLVPSHQDEIQEVRGAASEIEVLLADSTLPSAARARSDTRTLAAVADFYEARFLDAVNTLGQLADEENGALAGLDEAGTELLRAGTLTENLAVIDGISLLLEQSELYWRTGNTGHLDILRAEAEYLDEVMVIRIEAGVATSAETDSGVSWEEYSSAREALRVFQDQVDLVEELNNDFNNKAESLDALIDEAEPIWIELAELASQEAANATATAERISRATNLVIVIGVGMAVVLGSVITTILWRSFTDRLSGLINTTRHLEAGDLSARAEVVGGDEFGQLADTFNAMADQLQGMVSGLEAQTAERARALEIIAGISRAITTLREPQVLLREVVELVQDRFGFYHAQVFLLDETGRYAVLRESTGEAGRELLGRGHRLEVGSQSVIGQVTALGQPVVALDTDLDPIHRRNELLPDTRSEMALPMRIGDSVIGALDVQSVEPNAFAQDDMAVFQTMADQLAVALRNAQLFEDAQAALTEVEALNRRLVGQSWDRFVARRDPNVPRAFRIEGDEVLPEDEGLSETLIDEMLGREGLVKADSGENGEPEIAVPIRVRGEVIGAFGFGGGELANLSQEDVVLIEAVAERVGVALENARLFEQTQQQARREQLVNEITSKIVGSTDVTDILQTTARELGKVLRSPKTSIQLRGEQDDE